jgi:DNA-directed RNA polymerase subunit beta'
VTAPSLHTSHTILPDQVTWKNGVPHPIASSVKMKLSGGDIEERPWKEARYVLPSAKGMFNYSSNLIPFLPTDNGNRIMMADKQMEQAIGLKHRETPLVQSKTDHPTDPNHTFERFIGHFVATRSPVNGKVVAVKDSSIRVKMDDGKHHDIHFYKDFPLNDAKGMLHSEPLVKPGDTIKRGQVVADNNYTKGGDLAIGTNLRIGYIPYKGYNFEDGIVISETASKKLTSEHLHKKELDFDPERDEISMSRFNSFATTRKMQMKQAHRDALDENGIIKPGTKLEPGQVMVAAVSKNDPRKAQFLSGYNKKRAFMPYRDKSLVWDEDHIGTVSKVIRDSNGGVKVYVRTEEPAVIGDKLAGRHGNKGIITKIMPDHEMPFTQDKDGKRKALEVLLNPTGVPTRINPGQMMETAAGKIAEKTGKPYIVNNFAGPHHDYRTEIVDALKKHGISDEEHVYDPSDVRRPLGSVTVGPQYILKLKHQVEKKLNARAGITDVSGKKLPYDVDRQPTQGGDKGGQGFGSLELYALLGHDARHNIREMSTYKSDQQDAMFWTMIQTGHEPPPPKPPFAYNKFVGLLQGLGVNVVKEGTAIRIHPMNNKEVLRIADNGRNEIKTPKALVAKNLEPYKGGLFDKEITGGIDGDKWSYIKLHEPMPNPIFVGQNNRPGPIPTLLGLQMKQFEALMSGTTKLDGLTGGHAIEAALKKVNVEKEIEVLKKDLPTLRTDELDRANRKLKYLLALKEHNLKPHEAYVMRYVPVVPPKFRPASPTPDGSVAYSPLNGHYKNIGLINDKLTGFDSGTFSAEHKEPLRQQLWDSLKALQSVGNYKPVYDVDSSGNRDLAGILNIISKGGVQGQPKEGYFQAKVLKKRQNLSMRSTIIPEPNLHLDEVGLPRDAAMEMYKPYVVAQLVKWGQNPLKAQEDIKLNAENAKRALQKVIEERPVILKRDPVLHKFGVMAFRPRLVDGKAIQIHPLVTGGYNADFDGDTMGVSVPMSREAVDEAKKMFPSNNLFSPTNYGAMYTPGHESLLGLHLLTKWGAKTGKKYTSLKDLNDAVDKGTTAVDDIVHVAGFKQPTTFGRILVESRLPRNSAHSKDILHDEHYELSKKTLRTLAPTIAKSHPADYPKTIDALKDLGNQWSFKLGFSFGLKDLATIPERKKILEEYSKKAVHATSTIKDKTARDEALVHIWNEATNRMEEAQRLLPKQGNRLAQMVYSGARGDISQLRQMVAAPMLVEDSSGKTIPYPIKRSLSEGLDVADFWMSQHGARKGMIQKNRGTAEPGAITKDIINASMSTLIVSNDCKTTQGISLKLTDPDIHDRYSAVPYKVKGGTTLPAGTLLTPEVLDKLKMAKHEKISVRSALKCSHGEGICAKCFGLNESGHHHDIGTNIGILASQSMGEPSTQLSMNSFHTGGVAKGAGAKSMDAITRLRNLLEMPGTLRDEATVSREAGKITQITKDPAGGLDVYVNGARHYVPHRLVPKHVSTDRGNMPLAVGTEVKKGDQLSGGFTNPHKLLEATKDIHAVQNYLTKELHDGLFGNLGVRRRNIEVAVRSITNLAKVRDAGDSHWVPGDVIPRTVLEEHNRALPKGHAAVGYENILKGTGEIPHLITKDWLQRLNYQELHTTIQQAAAQGQKSELHGPRPIPGMAYGAEFGKPPPGSPKHFY